MVWEQGQTAGAFVPEAKPQYPQVQTQGRLEGSFIDIVRVFTLGSWDDLGNQIWALQC